MLQVQDRQYAFSASLAGEQGVIVAVIVIALVIFTHF